MKQRYRTLDDYFDQTGEAQTELARRLGISDAYMHYLRSGERQPSLPLALRIHEETGVPIDSLLMEPTP